MGGPVTVLNTREEFTKALGEPGLMVLDCFATWCGPCVAIAGPVEKLATKHQGDVRFYKIDVDQSPDIAQELGIRAMPTFIYFKNGEKIDEVVGANLKAIEAAVDGNKK